MSNKIQLRRGLYADLPTLDAGEPGFCTDTKELYVGSDQGNQRVMGDYVTPEMYGATGDGGHDDAPAINAALAAAAAGSGRGNIVQLRSGRNITYGIKSTLFIDNDTTLRGGGQINRSVIRLLDGANCDMIRNVSFGGAGSIRGIQVENLQLSGNSAGQGAASRGLAFSGVNFLKVKNVFVWDFNGAGIVCNQGTTWGATNECEFNGVRSHSNQGSGWVFDGPPLKLSLINCNAEGNALQGFHFKDNSGLPSRLANNIVMLNPYIEDNYENGILLESGANISIHNPFFWGGNNMNPAANAIDIGGDWKNCQLFNPVFYGVIGGSPSFYGGDILTHTNTRGVVIIGGISPLRPSTLISLYDAGSGGLAFDLVHYNGKFAVGKNIGISHGMAGLPSYTTDGAAGAGGLMTGDLYTITGTSPLQVAIKI